MQLGLGLYRHMLTPENFRFAKQAGATAIVAHLVDYWAGSEEIPATDVHRNWGVTRNQGKLWTVEELIDLRKAVEADGLKLAAIENLDPAHWHDVLLDGPLKRQQLADVSEIIRRMGRAGIPCLGYNFSIAGVWGHSRGPWARGGAESAESCELLTHHPCPQRPGRGGVDVLEVAPTTLLGDRAGRGDTVGARHQDLVQACSRPALVVLGQRDADAFPGQRSCHEHDLALDAADALATMGEAVDDHLDALRADAHAAPSRSMASSSATMTTPRCPTARSAAYVASRMSSVPATTSA
jgi:hypothetical protein